jgi:hypothetical protein
MTIKDQLERLPEPYRSLALKRTLEQACHKLNQKSELSVHMALYMAFKWHLTPEGEDFWDAVYDWAKAHFYADNPQLPPIPEE